MIRRVYSQDVIVYATIYVQAENCAEAARLIRGECSAAAELELSRHCHSTIPVSGRPYNDPQLPVISLSPAMTISRPSGRCGLVEVIDLP